MNTMYVLLHSYDYEGSRILGVFDSRMTAEKAQEKYSKHNEISSCESLDIEEFKLNKLEK
jgi:hypothetical protein